jgi:ATP-binding cassette, subfamily B, bacterial PglK
MTLTYDLKRLFRHVSARRRWQLAGLMLLMLLGAASEMATLGAVVPFLGLLANQDLTIDQYPIVGRTLNALGIEYGQFLLAAGLLFCFIAVLAAAIRMMLMWALYRFTYGLGADMGGAVYRHTLYRPYAWHVSHNTSEIVAGIHKIDAVTYSIIVQAAQGGVALLMTLGILGMLLAIDFEVAVLAGSGFAALYSVSSWITKKRLRENSQIIAGNENLRMQAVQEGLGGIRDVLLDGAQPLYHRRFAVLDHVMRKRQAENAFFAAAPRFVIESAGMVMIVWLAFWLSGREVGLTGAIPVLGALAIGAQRLLPQMQQIYTAWSSIFATRRHLHDVLDLLELPLPKVIAGSTNPLFSENRLSIAYDANQSFIAFRQIGFQYHTRGPAILNNINLDIPRGARVGIVGQTGSGKSTLVDLIMGLLEPTQGQILIDGQLLTAGNQRDWQSRIAHVPQTIFLSDSTICENIAFGIPLDRIDTGRVRQAAAQAQLTSFIENLPQQYDTAVGERGVRLSGGQRQRIGIARALYKQAQVLILDEATSALDDTTERELMKSLSILGGEITILMIAHRLSTLSQCGAILSLEAQRPPRWLSYEELVSPSSIVKQSSQSVSENNYA